MRLNFQNIFDKYAESKARTWTHDRTKTVGASEIFQCIRKTWATKHGITPDGDYKDSYGATSRGTLLEAEYVVPALRTKFPKVGEILWAGDDQITLVKGRLSATPDGLITGLSKDALAEYGVDDIEGDEILVEIKTFDSRLDLKEPKPIHVGQAQQQMGLTWETTNHRPNYTVILYVNASWLDDIRPFVVKRDPAIYEAAKKRADIVFDTPEMKFTQPEGKLSGGAECNYCPFASHCVSASLAAVPKERRNSRLSEAQEATLKTLIRAHKDASADEKAAKNAKTAAAEEIKAFLTEVDSRYAKAPGGFSASLSVSKAGRKSYDLERLVEDTGVNLADYLIEGAKIVTLRTRAPGDSEEEEDE